MSLPISLVLGELQNKIYEIEKYMMQIAIREIKDLIRVGVEGVPFGIGEGVLDFYRKVIGFRKKRYDEENEANRILGKIRNGELRKAIIVYDRQSSPPTFGDYFYTVMLARYFTAQEIPTSFLIIDEEYRRDWTVLGTKGMLQRSDDHLTFAKLLLLDKFVNIEKCSWMECRDRLSGVKSSIDGSIIIFREKVLSRSPIYPHSLNVLNYLCRDLKEESVNRFLLSFDEFERQVPFENIDKPYITYHCRRTEKSTSLFRNTADEEFLKVYCRLTELYSAHMILIVSDEVGCRHFRSLATRYNLDCKFSKDYSDSFFGDCGLVLGGDYHFALRGGGIDSISMFSHNPYEQFVSPINENVWGDGRATSWASTFQIYTDIRGSSKIFLPSGKVKLRSC